MEPGWLFSSPSSSLSLVLSVSLFSIPPPLSWKIARLCKAALSSCLSSLLSLSHSILLSVRGKKKNEVQEGGGSVGRFSSAGIQSERGSERQRRERGKYLAGFIPQLNPAKVLFLHFVPNSAG